MKYSTYKWVLIGFGVFTFLVATVLIVCILNIKTVKEKESVKTERVRKHRPEIHVSKDVIPRHHTEIHVSKAVIPPPKERQRIAIIIDDIGYDPKPLNELLKINAPITFSILPHCTYSVDAAEKLHRAGREILLHLPMEPHGYPDKDPGDGALFSWMNEEEIRRQIKRDIGAVPYISGVNNHMGSKFMEDKERLNIVFRQLTEAGLFFVDSLTTGHSKGRELAGKAGLGFTSRDIFIDNNQDPTIIFQNLMSLLKKRNQWKTLVFIGHPYPGTISALKEAVPKIKAKGIDIVPVSELINN